MTAGERRLRGLARRMADRLDPAERRRLLATLTQPERRLFDQIWPVWTHPGQDPPAGDWPVWLMVTGRGFGKTRAGAEWVSDLARRDGALRIALVGATIEDAIKVMVTGESGLIAVARTGETIAFAKTDGIVRFASGARAFLYSGACPAKLRGPEHHFAWCDELAKWRHPEEAWDNLQLGLRLGRAPRTLVTTTPKAIKLLRRLAAATEVEKTHGTTADNLNLPPAFVARMEAEYRGTRKGREELDGEIVVEADGALWTRELLERGRVAAIPPGTELERVVLGLDPPASAAGDCCGLVVCGIGEDGLAYVLADLSAGGLSPEGWARRVAGAAEQWQASLVVAEKNQGGEMIESVLRGVDAGLPVRLVAATRSKAARAEPVALRFETGQAKLAGSFPELEDQLCALGYGGYEGEGSPDRLDAMVWAMTELLRPARTPRVLRL